ncbi:MAG: ADP-ribosyl-[dinitrogen reductase] hydrolase [bacterium]|nr:ADP-ribosyl-[dinitrogen reductase] hydrolase [bacterium]
MPLPHKRLKPSGNPVRDRALAAYLGVALGDALGATTEFLRPAEIESRYGKHQDLTGGGWLHLKPGQVTDDTQMNLAVGWAMVEAKTMDAVAVGEKLLGWMSSKPADIGSTVRQGLHHFRRTGETEAPHSEYHAGNGAAMRILPVILACLNRPDDLEPWLVTQGHLTHNHPESDFGMAMLGQLSRAAILQGQGAPLDSIMMAWVEKNPKFDPKKFKRSIDGYIVNSMRTALYYFKTTRDFEECMVAIANAGGDTDTNATLAAMVAAPFYGLESLPPRWLKKLDKAVQTEITDQVEQLFAVFNPEA